MIAAVHDALQEQQYLRAALSSPGLGIRLGCGWQLYGHKPAGGMSFYTCERGELAALMIQGDSALGCGKLEPEELGPLLRMSGVSEYISADDSAPAGYILSEKLSLFCTPANGILPLKDELPTGFVWDEAPSPMAVSRLVWEKTPDTELIENFYSRLCTAQNHGMGYTVGAVREGRLVSTVGVYARWQGGSYMAGAETVPEYRMQGLSGALLARLCLRIASEGDIGWFWCKERLTDHYKRLDFIQKGYLYKFIQMEE